MRWRRFIYLFACLCSVAFYIAYGEWLSWIILLCVHFLPWLSLLLSLPAMLLLKVEFSCPKRIPMGTQLSLTAKQHCPLPLPPVQWSFTACENFTGKKLKLKGDNSILADHCGSIDITITQAWKYDYLGLFRLPLGKKLQQTVLVEPTPIVTSDLPSLKRYLAGSWRPKHGGGFAENYDLREYRPGDDLRQIHWKLTAKTHKMIFREPIVPVRGIMALSLVLRGDSDILDKKLGKLRYVSKLLLEKGLPHEIHCMTGVGLLVLSVRNTTEQRIAMDTLLRSTLTEQKSMPRPRASWLYYPGGEKDEV